MVGVKDEINESLADVELVSEPGPSLTFVCFASLFASLFASSFVSCFFCWALRSFANVSVTESLMATATSLGKCPLRCRSLGVMEANKRVSEAIKSEEPASLEARTSAPPLPPAAAPADATVIGIAGSNEDAVDDVTDGRPGVRAEAGGPEDPEDSESPVGWLGEDGSGSSMAGVENRAAAAINGRKQAWERVRSRTER